MKKNQQGLVSILVATGFVVIIALITTSFALLMRREQRQTLDRQLSTQAFYAAESGVNDAINELKSGPTDNDDCGQTSAILPNPVLDADQGVEYTCVLIEEDIKSLEFSEVGIENSTIIRVSAESDINSIRISWQAANGSSTFATNDKFFLPQLAYNQGASDDDGNALGKQTGILRATIIPTSNLNREDLISQSRTLYLYPKAGAIDDSGSFQYQVGQTDGQFADGKCNEDREPRFCSVLVHNLGGLSGKTYYLRLKSLYQPSTVTVEAFSGNSPINPLTLINSQAQIDATGKANDVLRRIQVRVPITNNYYYPEFALESGDDICKQLIVRSNSTTDRCSPYPNATPPQQ